MSDLQGEFSPEALYADGIMGPPDLSMGRVNLILVFGSKEALSSFVAEQRAVLGQLLTTEMLDCRGGYHHLVIRDLSPVVADALQEWADNNSSPDGLVITATEESSWRTSLEEAGFVIGDQCIHRKSPSQFVH